MKMGFDFKVYRATNTNKFGVTVAMVGLSIAGLYLDVSRINNKGEIYSENIYCHSPKYLFRRVRVKGFIQLL